MTSPLAALCGKATSYFTAGSEISSSAFLHWPSVVLREKHNRAKSCDTKIQFLCFLLSLGKSTPPPKKKQNPKTKTNHNNKMFFCDMQTSCSNTQRHQKRKQTAVVTLHLTQCSPSLTLVTLVSLTRPSLQSLTIDILFTQ